MSRDEAIAQQCEARSLEVCSCGKGSCCGDSRFGRSSICCGIPNQVSKSATKDGSFRFLDGFHLDIGVGVG